MELKVVHRGALHDVYQLIDRDGTWAVKAPAQQPLVNRDTPPVYDATTTLAGISTRYDIITNIEQRAITPEPRTEHLVYDLLQREASVIRASNGAWNHEVRDLTEYDLPDRGRTRALCTRWFDGTPLGNLPPAQQRTLFPRMLPALWDALCAARHGDVHASNLIVGDGRFALIDPGAMCVTATRGRYMSSSGAATTSFITNAASYPVLPPFCPALPAPARLADHWTAMLQGLTASRHFPSVPAGANSVMRTVNHLPMLEEPIPDGRPLPADLLAVGILYYKLLTAKHPFPVAAERGPAWRALEIIDDHIHGHELGAHCVAGPPRAPRSLVPSISPAEDALAMALLDLAIDSRSQLVELVTVATLPHTAR